MAKLNYKTRSMSSPQGKQRVYFCCHPKDFELYFTDISEEILKRQDCAIWYEEDLEHEMDAEEMQENLKQMQLFVIPVTSRFLLEENTAKDIKFAYAMEQHIPILPLMQEVGLETLFNKKCGDLQFLDKYCVDHTAIRYEEKLDKFLESVLIGDKLAEQIRKAFDAYVFLSYRKKDRKHARQLMRLIHKNDFCRDIAIWYDEFLTPGENFNDAIGAAMAKSSLFAMAVTPNLVNEENYVMTTEYPMAKKANKKIVAVEMVPTDHEELAKKYEDFPGCVAGDNETVLSESLLEAVKELALRENDHDPEHNYFMGLAYLNGIDVEVDHSRAVDLIFSAGEGKLPEAWQKLSEMCKNGIGVKRDYKLAAIYQENVVVLRKEMVEKECTAKNILQLAMDCARLADCLDTIWDEERKIKVYEQLVSLCKEFEDIPGLSFLKRLHLLAAWELGRAYRFRGRLEEAESYFKHALDIAMSPELAKEERAAEDLVRSYHHLGELYMVKGKLQKAKDYYKKAEEISLTKMDEKNMSVKFIMLWENMEKAYRIHFDEGNIDEAENCCGECLELLERLQREDASRDVRTHLWATNKNLGDLKKAKGQWTEALDHFTICLNLAREIYKETENFHDKHRLANSYGCLGESYEQMGQMKDAREHYEKEYNIIRDLNEAAGTVEIKEALCHCYYNMGILLQNEGAFSEAKSWHENRLKMVMEIKKEADSLKLDRQVYECYFCLGSVSYDMREYSEAKEWYEKAFLAILEIEKEDEGVSVKENIMKLNGRLGNAYRKLLDYEKSEAYCQAALVCARKLDQEMQTDISREWVATYLDILGRILLEQKKYEETRTCFEESLRINICLNEKRHTFESENRVSVGYNDLGDLFFFMGDYLEAQRYYEKSFAMLEELGKKAEGIRIIEGFFSMYERLGRVCRANKNWDEAKDYYARGFEYAATLFMEKREPEFRQKTIFFVNEIGYTPNRNGQKETMYEYLREQMWSKMMDYEEEKTERAALDLATVYLRLGLLGAADGAADVKMLQSSYELLGGLVMQDVCNSTYWEKQQFVKKVLEEYGVSFDEKSTLEGLDEEDLFYEEDSDYNEEPKKRFGFFRRLFGK